MIQLFEPIKALSNNFFRAGHAKVLPRPATFYLETCLTLFDPVGGIMLTVVRP